MLRRQHEPLLDQQISAFAMVKARSGCSACPWRRTNKSQVRPHPVSSWALIVSPVTAIRTAIPLLYSTEQPASRLVHSRPLDLRQHMRVRVHRQRDLRAPQRLHHRARSRPGGQHGCCARVWLQTYPNPDPPWSASAAATQVSDAAATSTAKPAGIPTRRRPLTDVLIRPLLFVGSVMRGQ